MVKVTFQELDIEWESDCDYDSVKLYDGSDSSSPLLGTYCARPPTKITSTGSSLYIVFESDHSVNDGRFSLSWTFVSEGDQGRLGLIVYHTHLLQNTYTLHSCYVNYFGILGLACFLFI